MGLICTKVFPFLLLIILIKTDDSNLFISTILFTNNVKFRCASSYYIMSCGHVNPPLAIAFTRVCDCLIQGCVAIAYVRPESADLDQILAEGRQPQRT